MFGWEFPPFFAGGVGMVCYELTKQLVAEGVDVQYVMPFCPDELNPGFLKIHNAAKLASNIHLDKFEKTNLKITRIESSLVAYQTEQDYRETIKKIQLKHKLMSENKNNTSSLYGETLFEEIELFAKRVEKMYFDGVFNDFDVIHAHDWTTIPAAVKISQLSGKPLIVHVHITEFNKTGNNTANPRVYAIEKQGFDNANKIISISNLIKQTLTEKYQVPSQKIEVIHNGGIEMNKHISSTKEELFPHQTNKDTKIVLFAGRITGMKGPMRFVEMANLVLKYQPNTLFVMAGSGDQLNSCINKAHQLKIFDKFNFFGFYTKEDAEKLYSVADVFVLPSQQEPFGVTPLEAMCKNTSVVLSKQSGVAEVVKNCLFVDFWDVEKMASQVTSLLTYSPLNKLITKKGYLEAKTLDWKKPTKQCINLYEGVKKK